MIGRSGAKPVERLRAALLLASLAALVGVGGCGGKAPATNKISGATLTIYSSAPLDGPSSTGAQAVVNGELLALARIHNRIGKYHIHFEALDDATVQRAAWDPGQTTNDARQAVQDRTTIGYIGEFDSGASAVAIPLLNRAGIAQISATGSAVGLTSAGPGASPGEPQKYYPTGVRTFARVVPNDAVQAIAQVRLVERQGCAKTFVLDDGDVDGSDAATSFLLAAQAAHLPVVGDQRFDPRASDYSTLVDGVTKTGADCVLISAAAENHAALITGQLGAALPNATIFGFGGVAETAYTDPTEGGIPASLARRVLITVAPQAPQNDSPAGRTFSSSYEQRFGALQPYAICGYEAMSLMLDAIARATRDGTRPALRSKVVAAIFSTRDRRSVLGTYSIDRDGDTTLRRIGVYRVVAGQLNFWKGIDG